MMFGRGSSAAKTAGNKKKTDSAIKSGRRFMRRVGALAIARLGSTRNPEISARACCERTMFHAWRHSISSAGLSDFTAFFAPERQAERTNYPSSPSS